jgi:hypothetical protein
MADMKMSKEEKKEQESPMSTEEQAYPYGLRIDLNDDSMTKLGLDSPPKVGATFRIMALADVVSVSSYSSMSTDQERSMSLQITDMEMAEGTPAGESAAKTILSKSAK